MTIDWQRNICFQYSINISSPLLVSIITLEKSMLKAKPSRKPLSLFVLFVQMKFTAYSEKVARKQKQKTFFSLSQLLIIVAHNSFLYFPRLRFWWFLITSLYHLMLQSWYQKTAQSPVNTLVSISWPNRLPWQHYDLLKTPLISAFRAYISKHDTVKFSFITTIW